MYKVLVILLNTFIAAAVTKNAEYINIDLSKFEPQNKNTHIIQHACTITDNTTEINVLNIPSTVGFFVVQVHSYVDDVVISNNPQYSPQTFINGTNIGLVQIVTATKHSFALKSTKYLTSALIVVIAYTSEDPIPGGCNLTFQTEIAPYQKVYYNEDMIRVDAQAASLNGRLCENTSVHLDMYHLYLREKSNDEEMYFGGIKKMLTVDDIIRYGRKVPEPVGHSLLRRFYNVYRGTGSVFAVIATYKNGSSAYVPAVSYGCDVRIWDEDCNEPISGYWKFIIATVLFMGIFICYLGHSFFKTTLFFVGFIAGTFITYIVLALGYELTLEESTTTSCLFGVIYGIFWVLIWWQFGVPLLSVMLSFFLAGMLLSSVTFYAGLADVPIFQNDINFWTVFLSITLTFSLIFIMMTFYSSNILVCSIIGSYAMLAPLSYYAGANLQYIVINTYRRITVRYFNLAVIDPPYQAEDIGFTVAWILISLCSFYIQWRMQKGRPPFPPHRFLVENVFVRNETTPLLSEPPTLAYTEMAR